MRVINAIPAGAPVTVLAGDSAAFSGVKEAGWDEIDPIAGTLEIRPDGKTNVLASVPNVKLEGGKSYTFVVAGTPAKPDIIKVEDEVAKSSM